MSILLYSSLLPNRLLYISSFIFKNILNVNYEVTSNLSDYQSFKGMKINYSNTKGQGKEVWIKPHDLLFQKKISNQKINTSISQGVPVFFNNQTQGDLSFDLFASSFYMLSRYEEYLPFDEDAHHRFSAHQSLAYHNAFLEYPIIHQWVDLLVAVLQKKFPNFKPTSTPYTFYPTYDIDIPWAFRYRGIRGWGRAGLDFMSGRWPLLKARFEALMDENSDPFFCFETIKNNHKKYDIRPKIFWLIADSSRHDINPNYRLKVFRDLILDCNSWSDSGIHPSYQSNENPSLLKQEKERLENILGRGITSSRQHFLRLHLPQTYRQLVAAGIEHDYSMGFADKIGYRAGTSESFLWYDLEREEITGLNIHPFVAMDVSLKQYEGLTAEQGLEKLQSLQNYCKQHGLSFRTLWHNSSFSDLHGWKGWQETYWKLFE